MAILGMKKNYRLSKSKYLTGLQCPKALWISIHRRDLVPPIDVSTQAIFDMGREVGEFPLSEAQRRHVEAAIQGQGIMDRRAIRGHLRTLEYPLYYLDFETAMTGLPPCDGLRPYDTLTFQASLHLQAEPGGAVEHFEYLGDGKTDPQPGRLGANRLRALDDRQGPQKGSRQDSKGPARLLRARHLRDGRDSRPLARNGMSARSFPVTGSRNF